MGSLITGYVVYRMKCWSAERMFAGLLLLNRYSAFVVEVTSKARER